MVFVLFCFVLFWCWLSKFVINTSRKKLTREKNKEVKKKKKKMKLTRNCHEIRSCASSNQSDRSRNVIHNICWFPGSISCDRTQFIATNSLIESSPPENLNRSRPIHRYVWWLQLFHIYGSNVSVDNIR